MSNYYEILGLTPQAGILEIKTAFRALAKLYHPDKNPQGKEQFDKILRAYETLSDPRLKSTYDYRLANNLPERKETKKTTKEKNWSFEEKELKRRRYYDEYIKRFEKNSPKEEVLQKQTYNEYKNILFATPLAVVLFILIMQLSDIGKAPESDLYKHNPEQLTAPYVAHFGQPFYAENPEEKIKVKNNTGVEVIVCLFTKNKFIRSFYIKSGDWGEIVKVPKEELFIKYCSGINFDSVLRLEESGIIGGFTEGRNFFMTITPKDFSKFRELTLLSGLNEGFKSISEKDFFKR